MINFIQTVTLRIAARFYMYITCKDVGNDDVGAKTEKRDDVPSCEAV